jgi:hypothetical protein
MPAAGPGTIPQREENMIRAGVHFLLAIGVFASIVWGSMGLWDIATGSLGNTAEWGAILVFGFMGAAVMGLALIYNEIVAEIHNE